MQMMVQGASTRREREITTDLCGRELSESTVSQLSEELDKQVEACSAEHVGVCVRRRVSFLFYADSPRAVARRLLASRFRGSLPRPAKGWRAEVDRVISIWHAYCRVVGHGSNFRPSFGQKTKLQ